MADRRSHKERRFKVPSSYQRDDGTVMVWHGDLPDGEYRMCRRGGRRGQREERSGKVWNRKTKHLRGAKLLNAIDEFNKSGAPLGSFYWNR